jgi:hypothetical protein
MMMRLRFFPVLFLLFSVSPGAQTVERILETSGLSAGQRSAVLAEFEEAEVLGIPEAFLLPRIEEGMAKNVPAPRIIEVIRREREAFALALGLLKETGYAGTDDTGPPVAEWQRTAHLLLSGLAEADTASLLRAFAERKEAFRQGTNLYLALVKWGIDPEDSLRLTSAAAASPLEADSFMGIPEIFIEARRQRIRTVDIIERIAQELPRSRSLESLKNRVLY